MALKSAEHFPGHLTLFPKFAMVMIDDFVKSRESLENVIPAKAGIQ